MTETEQRSGIGRRGFLVGLSALIATGASYLRWGSSTDRGESRETLNSTRAPRNTPTSGRDERTGDSESAGFFAEADHIALFALADVIVPRDGEAPAASEIGLLPLLEEWIRSDSARRFTYSALWPELARAVHPPEAHSTPLSLEQLEERCGVWHADYRARGARASSAAQIFEQLRRDVLRVYYSTEAGHNVLGYSGPAMRMGSPSAST
jgi:hypothetical protein